MLKRSKSDPICARSGCGDPLSSHKSGGCEGRKHPETEQQLVCAVMCDEFLEETPSSAPPLTPPVEIVEEEPV